MWAQNKQQIGFTIVELLIVIVVISILAAITIVAYNGIQDRARLAAGLSFEYQIKQKTLINAVGVWSFDECSGTVAKNVSDNASDDVAATGSFTWITDTPSGRGCAIKFNGATRIETTAKLGQNYYVKGAWIRANSASCGSSINIISKGAGTNGADVPFYLTSGCKLSAGYSGSYTAAQYQTPLSDNKWHYVAAEWDQGTLSLYVDGSKVVSTTGVPAPTPVDGNLSIASHGTGNFFNGDIDNPYVATY
jgi:prepilin-type N-terminal cleavage/methylation domain-containing protein